jgi:hypothetical protein
MAGLESQEEDAPKHILLFKTMSWLGQIRSKPGLLVFDDILFHLHGGGKDPSDAIAEKPLWIPVIAQIPVIAKAARDLWLQ